ncbi:MAG: hypothetical protein HKN12_03790, partial [Gemmatimonadetes bacterium]|nr:hypothetical protein [Gemmatimonadota bacterium]
LGPGSGLWDKFLSLASAPAMPVFGSGKNAMQPVHVDDVALCVAAAVSEERLGDRTREFGGRDTLPMKEFVQRIRKAAKGKDGPAVHLPVKLLIGMLSVMEKFLFSVMPVAAGQFYVFAYDAAAEPADDIQPALDDRRGVDDIIAEHLAAGSGGSDSGGGSGGGPGGAGAAGSGAATSGATGITAPIPPPSDQELEAECRAFVRYLIGEEPSAYVIEKYRAAHQPGVMGPAVEADDPLTAIARRGPGLARLVDSWAVFFARGGTLRRKLILLVAILENIGASSAKVDTPDPGTPLGFFLGLGFKGVRFALTLVVALVAVPVLKRTAGKAPA